MTEQWKPEVECKCGIPDCPDCYQQAITNRTPNEEKTCESCEHGDTNCGHCDKAAKGEPCNHTPKQPTNREAHEEAAGMPLDDSFFRYNNIDPDAPAEQPTTPAIEPLECTYNNRSVDTGLACPICGTSYIIYMDIDAHPNDMYSIRSCQHVNIARCRDEKEALEDLHQLIEVVNALQGGKD
jgi:hypothetical protein